MKKGTKKIAAGAAFAGAVGYMAGILTAPKSGKETRKDLKNATLKARTDGEKQLKALHSELNELITKGKQGSSKLSESAKTKLAGVLSQAQAAKERARTVLSNLHEGEAENTDLKTVIKDVDTAISSLRRYTDKQSKTTGKTTKRPVQSAAAGTATKTRSAGGRRSASTRTAASRRPTSKKS